MAKDVVNKQEKDNRPWYKEPMVWFIIALPTIAVVSCFFTLYLALNTTDSLVTDDYYKEGKNIIYQIERDKAALSRNIQAQVFIQNDMDGVMVLMQGDYDTADSLRLSFVHPTIKDYDQSISLVQSKNNPKQYTGTFKSKLPNTNQWIVRIEDSKNIWRIESRWIESQGNAVTLVPKNSQLLKPEF